MRNPVTLALLMVGALLGPVSASAQADSSASQAAFWRQLGDTTLDRLLERALQANQDLRAAEARLKGARAARTGAVLDLFPTVTAGGGFVRERLPRVLVPSAPGTGPLPDQSIWDGGFDASWEIDIFGRLRNGLRAQGAFTAAAREELREVQVSLTAELARAYFELRGGQGLLEVARRNADNQRNTLEVTRQRLDAGRGTAFDTERAQAQLSFTLASIPAVEAGVAQASYR
ncbi:MAG TPA: TolC family protein, partial [Gemmatimonadales bacterium]|nr:TolC family protein [Gemmatimonadales bacterium]